jgi:hypothetical protein
METMVAATTALLLWTRAVLRTPIARPVIGAVLAVIIPRMPFCHSAKTILNPLFTPSRDEMNRNIPNPKTRRRRTFLLESMGIPSQTDPAPLRDTLIHLIRIFDPWHCERHSMQDLMLAWREKYPSEWSNFVSSVPGSTLIYRIKV